MARTAFLNESSRLGALGIPSQWTIRGAAAVDAQNDNIVADVAPVADTVTALTIAAQPDVPRCLRINCEDANASITLWRAELRGLDFWNKPIHEIVTRTTAGVTDTSHAFRSLTSATIYVEGTVTASVDLFSIGTDTKLGMPVKTKVAADLLAARKGLINGEVMAADAGTIDHVYHTYEPENAPDADDYEFDILSTWET